MNALPGADNDGQLNTVYTELAGMLEQFQNKIQRVLAFFDTQVYKPIRFSEIDDLKAVIPADGGGTDFSCLFNYIASTGMTPTSSVIFTDGRGEYPDEVAAGNIPVLWLLTSEAKEPPRGRCARCR